MFSDWKFLMHLPAQLTILLLAFQTAIASVHTVDQLLAKAAMESKKPENTNPAAARLLVCEAVKKAAEDDGQGRQFHVMLAELASVHNISTEEGKLLYLAKSSSAMDVVNWKLHGHIVDENAFLDEQMSCGYFDQALFFATMKRWVENRKLQGIVNQMFKCHYANRLNNFLLLNETGISKNLFEALEIVATDNNASAALGTEQVKKIIRTIPTGKLETKASEVVSKIIVNHDVETVKALAQEISSKASGLNFDTACRNVLIQVTKAIVEKNDDTYTKAIVGVMKPTDTNGIAGIVLAQVAESIDSSKDTAKAALARAFDEYKIAGGDLNRFGQTNLDSLDYDKKFGLSESISYDELKDIMQSKLAPWKKRLLVGKYLKDKVTPGQSIKDHAKDLAYTEEQEVKDFLLDNMHQSKTIVTDEMSSDVLERIIKVAKDNGFNDPALYFRALQIMLQRIGDKKTFSAEAAQKTIDYAKNGVKMVEGFVDILPAIGADPSVADSAIVTDNIDVIFKIVNRAADKEKAGQNLQKIMSNTSESARKQIVAELEGVSDEADRKGLLKGILQNSTRDLKDALKDNQTLKDIVENLEAANSNAKKKIFTAVLHEVPPSEEVSNSEQFAKDSPEQNNEEAPKARVEPRPEVAPPLINYIPVVVSDSSQEPSFFYREPLTAKGPSATNLNTASLASLKELTPNNVAKMTDKQLQMIPKEICSNIKMEHINAIGSKLSSVSVGCINSLPKETVNKLSEQQLEKMDIPKLERQVIENINPSSFSETVIRGLDSNQCSMVNEQQHAAIEQDEKRLSLFKKVCRNLDNAAAQTFGLVSVSAIFGIAGVVMLLI